jgi:hypothetical protein
MTIKAESGLNFVAKDEQYEIDFHCVPSQCGTNHTLYDFHIEMPDISQQPLIQNVGHICLTNKPKTLFKSLRGRTKVYVIV